MELSSRRPPFVFRRGTGQVRTFDDPCEKISSYQIGLCFHGGQFKAKSGTKTSVSFSTQNISRVFSCLLPSEPDSDGAT